MRSTAFLLILFVVACNQQPAQTAQPVAAAPAVAESLTPEKLGELGAQIKANPDDADRLLSERGLTRESFEHAIRKTAEDPTASKRYAAAFHSHGG